MEDKQIIIDMVLQHLDFAIIELRSDSKEAEKDIEQAIQLLRKLKL